MFWRPTNQDFNIRLVGVKNEKYNGLLAGVSFPPSSRAPRVSLGPKTPFPFLFKCLPRRLDRKGIKDEKIARGEGQRAIIRGRRLFQIFPSKGAINRETAIIRGNTVRVDEAQAFIVTQANPMSLPARALNLITENLFPSMSRTICIS